MKTKIHFLAGALLLTGCATQSRPHHPLAREVIRRGTEPEYCQIQDEDVPMRGAVRKARKTIGVFITALKNPKSNQRDFEIKKPFVKGGEVEHIWLSDVEYDGRRFHGRVDNQPVSIKGLKLGDRVSVNPDEISDWAYVQNGKLVGGYTIRVLCNKLSPERRKELEKEANFRLH